ncbi:hypothetical protein IU459_27195 [Nocardia amamiensis]|uniref:Uncharacterized protein n=1 Tax=Nocardia amamiensis TaxID=404578 RepID=A0ABS0CZC5_9NOCA|nr:hypothetical protein [Nocardia amamiensis]MBF6301203.1 hypothetical protein [Nocardia amamiensis]
MSINGDQPFSGSIAHAFVTDETQARVAFARLLETAAGLAARDEAVAIVVLAPPPPGVEADVAAYTAALHITSPYVYADAVSAMAQQWRAAADAQAGGAGGSGCARE